jgi:hypothetical protein
VTDDDDDDANDEYSGTNKHVQLLRLLYFIPKIKKKSLKISKNVQISGIINLLKSACYMKHQQVSHSRIFALCHIIVVYFLFYLTTNSEFSPI